MYHYEITAHLHYDNLQERHIIDWIVDERWSHGFRRRIYLIDNGSHGFQVILFNEKTGLAYNYDVYLTLEQGKEAFKKYKPKQIVLFED